MSEICFYYCKAMENGKCVGFRVLFFRAAEKNNFMRFMLILMEWTKMFFVMLLRVNTWVIYKLKQIPKKSSLEWIKICKFGEITVDDFFFWGISSKFYLFFSYLDLFLLVFMGIFSYDVRWLHPFSMNCTIYLKLVYGDYMLIFVPLPLLSQPM